MAHPEPNRYFNRDFGGMSGGPVFRIIDEVVIRLELVGFIYEYMDQQAVLARHADALYADAPHVR